MIGNSDKFNTPNMKFYQIFIFPILLIILLFPFSLNSADIFETSDGTSKILGSLNETIVLGNEKLNSTIFIIKTLDKSINPSIYLNCSITQKIVYKNSFLKGDLYLIKVNIADPNCKDENFYIKNGDIVFTDTKFIQKITTYSEQLNKFLDYNNSDLKIKYSENNILIHSLDNESFALKNKTDIDLQIKRIRKIYKMNNNESENNIINHIYKSRINLKYITPVRGKSLPTSGNLIPDAPRSYRKDTTDGIHHGYDIFARIGTPVQALGDGFITRIKRDFSWNDFKRIKKGNVSSDEKLLNLDIFRGNQVWLKTMDGNIIFYSHLGHVSNDIYEGKIVKVGEYLGNIDKTGVPDKEYKDFHLHFEIQQNPYIKDKANSNLDIMKWNWFGKGKSRDWILSEQKRLFN